MNVNKKYSILTLAQLLKLFGEYYVYDLTSEYLLCLLQFSTQYHHLHLLKIILIIIQFARSFIYNNFSKYTWFKLFN